MRGLLAAIVLLLAAEDDPFAREMQTANASYAAGDYAAAAKGFEAALALKPKDKQAKKSLAACKGWLMRTEAIELAKAGKPEEAIALLKKAKKADPDNAKAADESIAWVKKLEAAKTDDGKYTGMKQAFEAGNAYLAAGQGPQAEAAFRAALVFDAKQPAIHQGLGSALAMQTKWADAEAAFRAALEIDAKSSTLQYCLGLALAGQGKLDEAEKSYEQALARDSGNVVAHATLGALLRSRARFDEAEKHYKAALALTPDDPALKQALTSIREERAKVVQTEPLQ